MMTALSQGDLDRIAAINARVPGWSDGKHYAFFKAVLASFPWVTDLLMVGVYQGRDIAYILDVAERYHPSRVLRIIGIDKFSDTACADWPEDKRPLGWEAAGFGQAPDIATARRNLAPFISSPRSAGVLQSGDEAFFNETKATFDFVYLDTSHDYETVRRQLGQVPRVCHELALLAGDDYSDEGTWGVKRAVKECFGRHGVFSEWIWFSNRSELKEIK